MRLRRKGRQGDVGRRRARPTAAVPGFFASNRKLAIEGTPNVLDLAPTIYAALGLAVPKEFEGRALKIAAKR